MTVQPNETEARIVAALTGSCHVCGFEEGCTCRMCRIGDWLGEMANSVLQRCIACRRPGASASFTSTHMGEGHDGVARTYRGTAQRRLQNGDEKED